MSDKKQRAAAIQMASGPNVGANLLKAEQLVAEAVKQKAGLIVLPENFACMGKRESHLLKLSEPDGDGPLQDYLGQLAKRHGVWLVGGTIPMKAADNRKVRAACLVYDDEGKRVARYDKIHLFDVHIVETRERYVESDTIEPGTDTVVVDSPFGKLGIAVCYDLRFPELFRALLDKGAEIICLPAAFTAFTGKAHWKPLIRARAIENQCYVIAAGQGGFHVNGRETHGNSMIVDPWGNVLSKTGRETGSVSHFLDLDYLEKTRRNFPVIKHRALHLNCS
jgi:nitrilase